MSLFIRWSDVGLAGEPVQKVQVSDAEWRRKLTPEQYRVARGKGTERPHSGYVQDGFFSSKNFRNFKKFLRIIFLCESLHFSPLLGLQHLLLKDADIFNLNSAGIFHKTTSTKGLVTDILATRDTGSSIATSDKGRTTASVAILHCSGDDLIRALR